MNHRVEELILEAGFPKFDKMYVVSDGEELEKFCKLIVRECVKVMYDNAVERKVGLEIDKRPTYYAAAILEHFGVNDE